MLKTMSDGRRHLVAAGLVLGLVATALVTVSQQDPAQVEPIPDVVERVSLASMPIAPEDFGVSDPLDVRPTKLKRRETLSDVIKRLDLPGNDGHRALLSLTSTELLDARRVRPGLEVTAHVAGDSLNALSINLEAGRRLLAKRTPTGEYQAMALDSRLIARPMTVRGSIETSLYQDAQALGAEDQQVVDFAQVFAYDLDFQREVHPGDEFELVFNVMTDERGKVIRRGEVIYAALNGKAVNKAFYRFTTPDEDVTDYFQANGESST
ncbi:MAG: M23 family peptidase, partial [Pseudomonadota bacterium]